MKGKQNKMEYVIWGIPPKGTEEALLVVKFQGKNITDKSVAEKLIKKLESWGASKVRIQEIDLTDNKIEFLNTQI